jgi:hypothetical protein
VKRRTVSLSDDALAALDRIAREHRTTVSGVVEAAGLLLSDGGSAADALKDRLVPDRRGGDRRRTPLVDSADVRAPLSPSQRAPQRYDRDAGRSASN